MGADGGGVLAAGTFQTIDNQIDMTTGSIKLKAVFPNEDEKLWPGQLVSTRVWYSSAWAVGAPKRGPRACKGGSKVPVSSRDRFIRVSVV